MGKRSKKRSKKNAAIRKALRDVIQGPETGLGFKERTLLNREEALRKIEAEDRARLAKLPDPFCRYCHKRKPCEC